MIMDSTAITARLLRLRTIKGLKDGGHIDEATAKEILKGKLSPDDDSTFVDDSELLDNPLAELQIMSEQEV